METVYYALGIASVFVVALAIATIWAVVKVIKIKEQARELDHVVNAKFNQLERHTLSVESELSTRISNEVLLKQFETDQLINTRIDKVIDGQDIIHQEGRRYVDSRIDKLLNDPKFCLNNKSTKQLING
jgi:hypothetical protein